MLTAEQEPSSFGPFGKGDLEFFEIYTGKKVNKNLCNIV